MKFIKIFILLIAVSAAAGSAKKETIRNLDFASKPAFKEGEQLEYRVHYGLLTAGTATLEVKKSTKKQGQEVYHVLGKGRSKGVTEWVFRTRDHYESYIAKHNMLPVEFIRDIDEGGYKTKRHILFNHEERTAKDKLHHKDTVFSLENNMQDLFSAMYYARSLDASNLSIGDLIPIDIFIDHEKFGFRLKFMGKETIKSEFGNIRCLKFQFQVQEGRVFNENESAAIWISDDHNKVPVLLKSELFIGSIKMSLTNYKNLANPIVFK